MTTDIFTMTNPGDACIAMAGCSNSAVMGFLKASFIADAAGMTYQMPSMNVLQAAESAPAQYAATPPTDRGNSRG